MKKPVIRVYKNGDNYSYVCDFANKIYKKNLIHIKAIFWVLNIYYSLEKDENGQYLNRDNIKPVFDK
jgi:hypothetical protein